jgi:hypothetical protein
VAFSDIDRVRLSAGNSNSSFVATQGVFDEFRAGLQYADVAPIPEPGGGTLLMAGGYMLASARRRRDRSFAGV